MADFICKRCGECCGPIYFNKAEYKAVCRRAKNMGISLVKGTMYGQRCYLPRDLARKLNKPQEEIKKMIDRFELNCPFLGKDNEGKSFCRIYDVRPGICRIFGSRPDLNERLRCPKQEN
jgi:Fe-S-cluster containining protein